MLYMYLKIAWRNLYKSKISSFINIIGLATGMAVMLLIGLWIWDELSYNKYHANYDSIARLMRHTDMNGKISTRSSMAVPLRDELASGYGGSFKQLVLASPDEAHVLMAGSNKVLQNGRFMQPGAIDMLSLKMLSGSSLQAQDPSAIFLSVSAAKILFGDADPAGKIVKIDNRMTVHVAGIYEDVPYQSDFHDLMFVASWDLLAATDDWAQKARRSWSIHSFELFAQVAPHVDMEKLSASIAATELNHYDKAVAARRKTGLFLFPMSRWHLYPEWKDGINTGGRVQLVWLFGVIGALALLLACINFMNLTTARAEKRAKEVGVRKAVGSRQGQLVNQFFSESMLITCIAFMGALLLTRTILPFFNQIADKKIVIPWSGALFWLPALGICVVTGFLAGSYPAFYLSSFRPVKVLKGTFRAGRFAAVPRKVLVVVQFTVSVTLIAATMLVYSQIQYAKNRPVGYNREGLLFVKMTNAAVRSHYQAIEEGLLNTGAVTNVTASESPTTDVWDNRSGFSWEGKNPAIQADFATIAVRYGYGATVGWQFIAGRDFSKAFGADSVTSVVVNDAAAKFMGMKDPIGQKITWGTENITIIGVVKDMVMTSPYNQVKPTIYYINNNSNFIIVRLNPGMSAAASLAKIAPVFTAFNPNEPFDYHFVDQEYDRKFSAEERIGKLAGCFAALTIFISCIGLFGLASFVAQQRTREIGIRKVMGASVFALWKMLSGEFILLVAVAGIMAVPVAWHFLDKWLAQYQYHREVSPWFFITAGLGALLITLLTVSYHAISAATMSPVKSLRTE